MLIRTCLVSALTCLATASLMAADSPFVGKWKAHLEKSQITGTSMTVEDTGGGSYKIAFGDDIDTYYGDGKEHANKYGNMRTFTPDGPNKWNLVSKREGKVTSTGSFVLSEDGQTLTRTFEVNQPDGKTDKQVAKDKRTAGTSGLAGTWENTDLQMAAQVEMEIRPFEGDGLSFVTPAYKEHDDVKFDGKDYPDVGPRVAAGSTTSGKIVGERIIDLTDKLKDKPVDTQHLEVSEDDKTLTVVYTATGGVKPQTIVFERQ